MSDVVEVQEVGWNKGSPEAQISEYAFFFGEENWHSYLWTGFYMCRIIRLPVRSTTFVGDGMLYDS